METYVEQVEIIGLFGRYEIKQDFNPGVNIIYGENGVGKTTLLHILANALCGDFQRFTQLKFKFIKIRLHNEGLLIIQSNQAKDRSAIKVTLNKKEIWSSDKEDHEDFQLSLDDMENWNLIKENGITINSKYLNLLREKQSLTQEIVPVAYFPAFRTMIEAWAASTINREESPVKRIRNEQWKEYATKHARAWFGEFTPMINFPSLLEIEERLAEEIEKARMEIWRTDQELISNSFLNLFATLTKEKKRKIDSKKTFGDIQQLYSSLEASPLKLESRIGIEAFQKIISNLTNQLKIDQTALEVLDEYRKVFEQSLDIQKKSFKGLQLYQESVNEFFTTKKIGFKTDVPSYRRQSVGIFYDDAHFSPGFRTLSSGERQIITLIYASTHMSKQKIVLIDEPEISLHVDWQRKLISRMANQMGNSQIIACTHSPVIGADKLEDMRGLNSTISKRLESTDDLSNEEIPF